MYHQNSGRNFDMDEIVMQQLEVTLFSFHLLVYLEFNFEAIP